MQDFQDSLKDHILAIISEAVARKKEQRIEPCAVDMVEVQRQIIEETKEVINELCRDKRIAFHKTINGVAFRIPQ